MGRRRDFEDEDDSDWEDRPRRRSSKRDRRNRSMTTTLVIVGVSVVILIAGCGGFAWYAVTSMKKPMDAMLARLPAVEQQVGAGATGFFECIGEDRQPVEGAGFVEGLRDGDDGWREPGGIGGDGTEGIARDIPELIAELATNTLGIRGSISF
jgi:hypothetical protein